MEELLSTTDTSSEAGEALHDALEALLVALRAEEQDDLETHEHALGLCSEVYEALGNLNLFQHAIATRQPQLLGELLQVTVNSHNCRNAAYLPPHVQSALAAVVKNTDMASLRVLFESATVHGGALVKGHNSAVTHQNVLMWLVQHASDEPQVISCCLRHSRPFDINHCDSRGFTSLMVACCSTPQGTSINPETLHVLLRAGRRVFVNAQSTTGVLEEDCGASSRLGVTALMIAAGRGDRDAVEVLLSGGADITLTDRDAKDAFWYAKRDPTHRHLDTLSCLIKAAHRTGLYKTSLRKVR